MLPIGLPEGLEEIYNRGGFPGFEGDGGEYLRSLLEFGIMLDR